MKVSHAPHIRSKEDSNLIMLYTIIALLPALLAGLWIFGLSKLILVVSCVVFALITEAAMFKLRGRTGYRADFLSAVITGMLIAMVVSPAVTWWMGAIASVFAISIVKHAFGGLGFNIFNPALAARAFLLASWPVLMTTWPKPFDVLTGATQLGMLKMQQVSYPLSETFRHTDTYWQLLTGIRSGSLGETSAIAILLGGAFLLFKGVIDWRIPFSFIAFTALSAAVFGGDPIFHVLAGGLMLGAFFMATDPVTKPMSKKGRLIFGASCGLITILIRFFGGYPEGVCYAILIMNGLTPLIDRYTADRVYGRKK